MTLEDTLLLIFLFGLILIISACRYAKFDFKFSSAIVILSSIIFYIIYDYGMPHYKVNQHLKAFESQKQIHRCGSFQQTHISTQGLHSQYLIYRFKSDQAQWLSFNGDLLTQQYYPLLFQLKSGDAICFSYAADITDWQGHYYLTKLSKVGPAE